MILLIVVMSGIAANTVKSGSKNVFVVRFTKKLLVPFIMQRLVVAIRWKRQCNCAYRVR